VNIERVETWWESIPLTRPYRITGHATEAVEMGFVRLVADDGSVGFGCAAPVEDITGESFAACRSALERMRNLRGGFDTLLPSLIQEFPFQPAARAAFDMALLDARLRSRSVPFSQYFPHRQSPLATSVTIGILPLAETLADAEEYVARGFTILKVKIGEDLTQDVERLARLRERFGKRIALRADANVGYDPSDVERFFALTDSLDIQFLEQPCPRALDDEVQRLAPELRRRLAADESLVDDRDVERLLSEPRPFGIWNIKLMKCGGFTPGCGIASHAEKNGIELMWGCMDESVVSIAAALHAAYWSKATRYLDLDGSLDLARDPFRGGFELRHGVMHTLDAPGLGVERNV
jgi:L-alanine-DL-glutamate epimerase-like enolase superfamily enzyme